MQQNVLTFMQKQRSSGRDTAAGAVVRMYVCMYVSIDGLLDGFDTA